MFFGIGGGFGGNAQSVNLKNQKLVERFFSYNRLDESGHDAIMFPVLGGTIGAKKSFSVKGERSECILPLILKLVERKKAKNLNIRYLIGVGGTIGKSTVI